MKVIRWHHITREIVQSNPEKLFVFGDNFERRGRGGQAMEIRGEPNSFGIPTKYRPGNKERDFFSDKQEEFDNVAFELARLLSEFKSGRVIVIPVNGIGSGLSQLKSRSPHIHKLITEFIADLEQRAKL